MITIITQVVFNSLKDLYEHALEHDMSIGFESQWGDKYMVVPTEGVSKFLAVRPTGVFSSLQENYVDGYKLFKTKAELLDWMK